MTIAQAVYEAFQRHYRRWANRAVLREAITRLHLAEPRQTQARALAEQTLERMASVCEGLEVPEIEIDRIQIVLIFAGRKKLWVHAVPKQSRVQCCLWIASDKEYLHESVMTTGSPDEMLVRFWDKYRE